MILKKITYTYYHLPLAKKFINVRMNYKFRSGYIIEIIDELGHRVLGEAAPLIGFGSDNLDDALKSIKFIQENFKNIEIQDDFDSIYNFSIKKKLSPSVHFALDQCLISLLFLRNQKNVKNYFSKRKDKIAVNYVIGILPENEIISEIQSAKEMGFKTFKIKIGRKLVEDDVSIVALIREKFGDSINIRLDANGNWNFDNAVHNINKFDDFKIQYIEQPVLQNEFFEKIAEGVNIPIAPDESIKELNDAYNFLQNKKIKFIVLKPALFGSIFNSLEFIHKANDLMKVIIISSALETSIGRSMVNFIASITNHNYSHGLSTAMFYENDFTDNYSIKDGFIDISSYPPEFRNVCH